MQLRFRERTETARGEKTEADSVAVDYNGYCAIFTDKKLGSDAMTTSQARCAWLKALQNRKPFEREVWVEKLQKFECRPHIWVELPAALGGSLKHKRRLGFDNCVK